MKRSIAKQISKLINTHGNLMTKYTSDRVLNRSDDYIVLLNEEDVIGFISIKKIQWYQYEVRHLIVAPAYRNIGYGKTLMNDCLVEAKERGCKILQCTIKKTNDISKKIFLNNEFKYTSQFYNEDTCNTIEVYQKEITPCT